VYGLQGSLDIVATVMVLYTRTAIFGKNIIVSMSLIVMRVSDLHLFSYFYQSCSRTFGKAM